MEWPAAAEWLAAARDSWGAQDGAADLTPQALDGRPYKAIHFSGAIEATSAVELAAPPGS